MALNALVASTASGLTKFGVFTALLTTESLLFAAFAVVLSLASESMFGSRPVVSPGALALVAAIVLAAVASAAVVAWADIFADDWPRSVAGQVEALGLCVAIVVQPAIALLVAIGVVRG